MHAALLFRGARLVPEPGSPTVTQENPPAAQFTGQRYAERSWVLIKRGINHKPYRYLFFLSYSAHTKDEADDDDNKS